MLMAIFLPHYIRAFNLVSDLVNRLLITYAFLYFVKEHFWPGGGAAWFLAKRLIQPSHVYGQPSWI